MSQNSPTRILIIKVLHHQRLLQEDKFIICMVRTVSKCSSLLQLLLEPRYQQLLKMYIQILSKLYYNFTSKTLLCLFLGKMCKHITAILVHNIYQSCLVERLGFTVLQFYNPAEAWENWYCELKNKPEISRHVRQ